VKTLVYIVSSLGLMSVSTGLQGQFSRFDECKHWFTGSVL